MERYCKPGIFHANRIPVEMSAPRIAVESGRWSIPPARDHPSGGRGLVASLSTIYLSVYLRLCHTNGSA